MKPLSVEPPEPPSHRIGMLNRMKSFRPHRASQHSTTHTTSNSLGGISMFTSMLNPISRIKDNIVQRAEEAALKNKKDKAAADKKLFVLFCYIFFLLSYSITAMAGRSDPSLNPYTIYDMQTKLVTQLTGESLNKIDNSFKGNRTLYEVATVKDFYEWLRTTFHNGVYSASSFDGDPRFVGGGRDGFVMGQMMVLGGIRIGQFRSNRHDCMDQAPKHLFSKLYSSYEQSLLDALEEAEAEDQVTDDAQQSQVEDFKSGYYCYFGVDTDTESKETFANSTFTCSGDFDWENPPNECKGPFKGGYKYEPVQNERIQALILNRVGYTLNPVAFFETLPNKNGTSASELYATLYHSKFIDLQTRIVYIDISFWNFNVQRLITVRFKFDMPLSGGVNPSVHVKVADLYTCNIATLADVSLCGRNHIIRMAFEVACLIVITLIALVVMLQIIVTIFKILVWHYGKRCYKANDEDVWWDRKTNASMGGEEGNDSISSRNSSFSKERIRRGFFSMIGKVFKSKPRSWWMWNVFLLLQLTVYYAYLGSRYIAMVLVPTDVDPASDVYIDFQTPATWANYSDRINALFIFLSWVRLFEFISFFSGHGLFLFVLMFLVFIGGSALSNQIAFGYYVENYATFQQSFFSTFGALRGRLPYEDISHMVSSGLFGAVFGLVYSAILIYILMHLVLAILFALGQYMKKMFQNDPVMGMLLGNKNDDNVKGQQSKGGFASTMTAALGDLMKTGTTSSNKKGGNQIQSMMGKVESLMSLGGMFGVRKRAVSDHRRRSSLGGIKEEDGEMDDPHHPEMIRQHSGLVMTKLRTFTDMATTVGGIFGVHEDEVGEALTNLIEAADVGTGQISLARVLDFFKSIGMAVGPTMEATLHSIFGRQRESMMELDDSDEEGHSCLTAFGLKVPMPHVKLESLCIIMLAAVPLMSGDKKMREILPDLVQLDIIGTLAQDLIEHVARMLSIHCESVRLMKENGESSSNMILLPDTVVNGLDLIFNMVTASLDHIVPDEWHASAEAVLVQMRSGVHSIADYNPEEYEHVQGHLEKWTSELAKMKEQKVSKMDLAHAHANVKRRVSQSLGATAANKLMAEVGTMPVIKTSVKEDDHEGGGKHWGWGKVRSVGKVIGLGSSPTSPRHAHHAAAGEEVNDFLASVMGEHGYDDGDDDMFFESRL